MKQVRKIGYEYVELAGVGPFPLEEQKRICDGEGLTVIATHAGYGAFRDNMGQVIDNHKLLGAEYAILPGLPRELHCAEGYRKVAREMTGFARKLAKAGIGFAYHNHSTEFQRCGNVLGMDILFGKSDPKLVGSELDTYWVQHGGANTVTWIAKLAGRVPLLHLKDMANIGGQQVMMPVGEGNLEWPAIFSAAKKAGTKWLAVEEDVCQRPCLESVAISFKNLRKMGMC
jgi:sugar phosphate isomerase/epimerase